MNNNYHNSANTRKIIPSARRSIHDHRDCIFIKEYTMGRHGLINNKYYSKNTYAASNHDLDGVDEVDNIMSKFAQPIQIGSRRKRHNSSGLNDEDLISDSVRLSQSLPTYLQLKPHCRDDSSSDQEFLSDSNTAQDSYFSNHSYNNKNRSWNDTDTSNSLNQSQYFTKDNENCVQSNCLNLWVVSVGLLLAIALSASLMSGAFDSLNIFHHETVLVRSKYDTLKFFNDLSNVGEKYNVHDDKILQLQIGISSISDKQDTDSFMFVYNSKDVNFDPEIFNNFVNEVAYATAKYLRNESLSVRHVVVDSSSLVLHDSTELIDKYKDDVAKSGVILLQSIDTLPSKLAMALHYYCDEYNPLVKKSAIFSTLDLANCADHIRSSHEHIEKCLSKKWHSVPVDNIRPLLTRVEICRHTNNINNIEPFQVLRDEAYEQASKIVVIAIGCSCYGGLIGACVALNMNYDTVILLLLSVK